MSNLVWVFQQYLQCCWANAMQCWMARSFLEGRPEEFLPKPPKWISSPIRPLRKESTKFQLHEFAILIILIRFVPLVVSLGVVNCDAHFRIWAGLVSRIIFWHSITFCTELSQQ